MMFRIFWKRPTAQDVIDRIAQAAAATGWQAGVGATETAGMMVSYLANNPDRTAVFLKDGFLEAVGTDDPWAKGCLTFHSTAGEILTPAELIRRKAARKSESPTP